jgi:hypothetical protein
MKYPVRSEKNYHCLDFVFAHASFLLSWRLWRVPILTLPLGFRFVFEKPTFITCYDLIKKIWVF